MKSNKKYILAKIWSLSKELIGIKPSSRDIIDISFEIQSAIPTIGNSHGILDIITFRKTVFISTTRPGILIGLGGRSIDAIEAGIKANTRFNKIILVEAKVVYHSNMLDMLRSNYMVDIYGNFIKDQKEREIEMDGNTLNNG